MTLFVQKLRMDEWAYCSTRLAVGIKRLADIRRSLKAPLKCDSNINHNSGSKA